MKQTSPIPLRQNGRLSWGVTVLILFACFFTGGMPAQAQVNYGRATISKPVLDQFPDISFFLSAFDETGAFMEGLGAREIKILEDGASQAASSIELVEPGLQIILALNAGPMMANQYSGQTRYEGIQSAVLGWMSSQPASVPDDLSLLSNTGLVLTRSNSPAEWMRAVQDFNPNLTETRPGISSLSQALDMTTDPNPRENMKRVILYITVMPDSSVIPALPNLAQRAKQQNARVFVWLVATDQAQGQNSAGYDALNQLALDTGGKFFVYNGQNTLPDLETYLQDLRYLYRVEYRTALRTSGSHELAVTIEQPEYSLDAGQVNFTLDIRPPTPIFIAPPAELSLGWTENGESEPALVTPDHVDIQILVEFEDLIQRDLAFSRLYVDGDLVDENVSAPFDQFTWDLSGEDVSAQRVIQVEVGDVLGLSQKTIELPVNLNVADSPSRGLFQLISPQQLALYVGVFLAAAALVTALVVFERKIKNRPVRDVDPRRLPEPLTAYQDPGQKTQPAAVEWPSWLGRAYSNAPARLVRDPQTDAHKMMEIFIGNDLPLARRETTFGSDAQQAMVVIGSPAVSGLHARVIRTSDGKFILEDAGSVAGTWLNYAPVTQQGVVMEHGDLVHIGPLAFRYEMKNPPRLLSARVKIKDEEA